MPVSFDIFIYLSTNAKYVRYVKAGQVLDGRRLANLVSFGTECFHIRRDDLDKFKAYCAANYINFRIRDSKIRKTG
jgi:hypothetical protein